MIRSFAHKGLRRFFEQGSRAGIQPAHAKRLRMVLAALNGTAAIEDLREANIGIHALHGRFKGYWSVRVSGPWRIIFRFEDGHAWQINYIQYH